MKGILSLTLMGSLVLTGSVQAVARGPAKNEATQVEKIKAKVAKLGTGEKAKAEVKLKTGEKIQGYVRASSDSDFTLTNKKTGQTRTIAYAEVAEVKKPGLSTGVKLAIGVGIAAAVLAVVVIHARNHLFDDFHPF